MPATAGRIRMPANNRVHSSAALQTHGIWQSAIGYDPYAPNKDDNKDKPSQKNAVQEPEGENAYASFQGLLALARITGSNADEVSGACKRCGRVGHLTFQCRNCLSARDDVTGEAKNTEAINAAVSSGLEKLKGGRVKGKGKIAMESEESSEEEKNATSDSDYDSEMERLIAEKYGKRASGGERSKGRTKKDEVGSDGDKLKLKSSDGRKRGISKKRSVKSGLSDLEDEEEERRKRRKGKSTSRHEDFSIEEKERRRRRRKSMDERRKSYQYADDLTSEDSEELQRKRRRRRRAYSAASESDHSGLDDSLTVSDKKRTGKKSRKHRHKAE